MLSPRLFAEGGSRPSYGRAEAFNFTALVPAGERLGMDQEWWSENQVTPSVTSQTWMMIDTDGWDMRGLSLLCLILRRYVKFIPRSWVNSEDAFGYLGLASGEHKPRARI